MLPIYTINALMDLMTGQDRPGVEERGGGGGMPPAPQKSDLGGRVSFGHREFSKKWKKFS